VSELSNLAIGEIMKKFAGIILDGLNIYDYVARHKVSKAFLANYQSKFLYPDGCPEPQTVTFTIENCIKANLSLTIYADESVAIILAGLPNDKYLSADTKKVQLIRQLKLALQQGGYREAELTTLSLQAKIKAVQAIKCNITKNKDWQQSAKMLCHAVCAENLSIATDSMNAIASLSKSEIDAVSNERMASIYGLQISHCMTVMTYIESRQKVLRGPFYTEYESGYVEQIRAIYKNTESILVGALNALQKLPDPTPASAQHSRKRLLTFMHRQHPNVQVYPEDNSKKLGLSLDL